MSTFSADDLPPDFVATVSRHTPDREPRSVGGRPPPYRPDGPTWLTAVPRLVEEGLEAWGLRRDRSEPVRWGFTALVVPVTRPQGDPGMLKIGWPHREADVEHLALRAWKGRGAVRLYAAEPARTTYLLERLDPTQDLTQGPTLDANEVIGTLLATLDRPAPPWAPRLSDELSVLRSDIITATTGPAATRRFPRRMLQHAASLVDDLLAAGDLDQRLVHTDLHQTNVLRRPDPGEWVAIDPKVVAGDPHWAVAPSLWNRWDDALAARDVGAHLLSRLEVLCEAAGLDPDRARAMTILRLVQNALWAIREPRDGSEDELTRAVAVVKAMQRR